MHLIRYLSEALRRDGTGRNLTHALLLLGGVFWILLIAAGFFILSKEEFTPVSTAPRLAVFPPHSAIKLASDRMTLLLFAHPLCPCTRASLHELDGVLADTGNKLSVIVVFTIPEGVPPGWEKGELWTLAEKIEGVRIFRDQDGLEARRFGVAGSGDVLLYNTSGELLFSGGITPSRGHEGDNQGSAAVKSFALTGHASINTSPVFGCSLL